MCNLSNILQTANIIVKTFPCRHLATVDKRFVTLGLQRIRIVLIVEKTQIDIYKQRETRRQSKLEIAASYTSCNEALLMSFAQGPLRPEFRFSNGL